MRATLRIEQLAAETGMSVRNIRAHQARGLVRAPEVRHRVGYYGPDHVAQLRLVRELQDDGFNLAAIRGLLSDPRGIEGRLARLRRALAASADATASADAADAADSAKAADSAEAANSALLGIAEELVAHGASLQGVLAVFEEVEQYSDAVSELFVKLFLREIWRPFARARLPAQRWPEIDEAIDRLGPLATAALLAIFSRRMSAQVQAGLGRSTSLGSP